ncbi:MAG: hypothetical protein XD60_0055 [Acetothermia bacterium 64_32]|nr:MAG: hypothetical protein XD60_0055 [Acetothermia bacterium 64_32]HAF70123.1 hypothetical protein [Candidatus Acetothermia bacterium]
MTVGIVLGALLVLCLLALGQRVRIALLWGPKGRSVKVRYSFLRFQVPKHKERGRPKKGRRRRETGGHWLKLAPELLRAGWKGFEFSLRHCELGRLRVDGKVGGDDPVVTGILWGAIRGAHGALWPWGHKMELAVRPDFDGGGTSIEIHVEGAVRLGTILAAAAVVLWHLPKRKLWRLLREQRRARKASPKPGLKSNQKKEVVTA